ncbi:MAG: phosphotriesterase [Bacteroidota bacterium]
MNTFLKLGLLSIALLFGCKSKFIKPQIQDLQGLQSIDTNQIWLSHEHILVDFIGADSIQPSTWNHDSIIQKILPYLEELSQYEVDYFVDATPNFLGRNVRLLEKLSQKSGLKIMTNTGLYGARDNKFIPQYAKEMSAEELAQMWIKEFEDGIDGTDIKPGFIKIGVDYPTPLKPMHQKLVKAAALTHLETGLTIASHTGPAEGVWPQLQILHEMGVSPNAFIWVHANQEADSTNYLKAAEAGCWISLDGLGWEFNQHVEKLLFAKEHGILASILISHDAGWYDPQRKNQRIQPYTNIFKYLIPKLKSEGFTQNEIDLLLKVNPVKAFSLIIRQLEP